MWSVRVPDLEDWDLIVDLWTELQKSPQAKYIDGDVNLLKEYLKASWTSPLLNVWGVFENRFCWSLVVTQVTAHPEVRNSQVITIPSLFIRAVYTRRGAPSNVTKDLDKTITEFAKVSGCVTITGACRMDFPVEAAKRRHGYTSSHIIMTKEVN